MARDNQAARKEEKSSVDKRNSHRSEERPGWATDGVTLGKVPPLEPHFNSMTIRSGITPVLPISLAKLKDSKGNFPKVCCKLESTIYGTLNLKQETNPIPLAGTPSDLPSPCSPLLSSQCWQLFRGKLLEDSPLQPMPRTLFKSYSMPNPGPGTLRNKTVGNVTASKTPPPMGVQLIQGGHWALTERSPVGHLLMNSPSEQLPQSYPVLSHPMSHACPNLSQPFSPTPKRKSHFLWSRRLLQLHTTTGHPLSYRTPSACPMWCRLCPHPHPLPGPVATHQRL